MLLQIREELKIGQKRIVKLFAILPRRINPEQVAWLRTVWAVQTYSSYGEYGNGWASNSYHLLKEEAEQAFA